MSLLLQTASRPSVHTLARLLPPLCIPIIRQIRPTPIRSYCSAPQPNNLTHRNYAKPTFTARAYHERGHQFLRPQEPRSPPYYSEEVLAAAREIERLAALSREEARHSANPATQTSISRSDPSAHPGSSFPRQARTAADIAAESFAKSRYKAGGPELERWHSHTGTTTPPVATRNEAKANQTLSEPAPTDHYLYVYLIPPTFVLGLVTHTTAISWIPLFLILGHKYLLPALPSRFRPSTPSKLAGFTRSSSWKRLEGWLRRNRDSATGYVLLFLCLSFSIFLDEWDMLFDWVEKWKKRFCLKVFG